MAIFSNYSNYHFFFLGWPLEWTEILIIFVPIFLPLLEIFGVNPYFFAMLIALNLQTSFFNTPNGNVCLLFERCSV